MITFGEAIQRIFRRLESAISLFVGVLFRQSGLLHDPLVGGGSKDFSPPRVGDLFSGDTLNSGLLHDPLVGGNSKDFSPPRVGDLFSGKNPFQASLMNFFLKIKNRTFVRLKSFGGE
jgi:hypothetical protein